MSRVIRSILALAVPACLALGAPAAALPPDAVQELYVDAAEGFDSDACGAIMDPCRSIQAAVDRIPHCIDSAIIVHVAAGVYGGVLVSDRGAHNGARITISGDPGRTVIAGSGHQAAGVIVQRASGVTLESLAITGFDEAGIKVIFSTNIQIRGVTVSGNNDGIYLGESLTTVTSSSILANRRHGLSCEGGWVSLGEMGPGLHLTVADNGVSGVRTDGCRVGFAGPAEVSGPSSALLALHGGVIDLGMREDVSIVGEGNPEALVADCHGMIVGYENSCAGNCGCAAVRFGICEAVGPANTGRRRPDPVNENQ